MDQQFAARLWAERKQLRSIDRSLLQAQAGWMQLEGDRQAMHDETGDFAARVSALQQRIGALQARLAVAEAAQSRALAKVAIHDLKRRKKRLQGYRVQAQFALAALYDQAAHAGSPAPTAVSPGMPQP
jgi:predicted  nucleic acid-binding Zn-ribbon protein